MGNIRSEHKKTTNIQQKRFNNRPYRGMEENFAGSNQKIGWFRPERLKLFLYKKGGQTKY